MFVTLGEIDFEGKSTAERVNKKKKNANNC